MDRNETAAALRTGTSPDPELALRYLRLVFADCLQVPADRISPEEPLDVMGLDSLTLTNLTVGIEDEAGAQLLLHELDGGHNLTDLAHRMVDLLTDGGRSDRGPHSRTP